MKRTKKLLIWFTTLCMVLIGVIAISNDAQAAESDFVIKNGVLTKYTGSGGDVVIPDGVKEIGFNAFYGCVSLTNITIPDSVTSIDYDAFHGCSNLTNVIIPKGVTRIASSAFVYCVGLTEMTILNPKTVLWYDKIPEPYLNIFTIEGELFIDMTKFKNPVVTIKGYANSTAEKLVDALNECRIEYIDRGNTYNTTFKFAALDGTGGKDNPTQNQTYQLLQKVKAAKSMTIKKGKSKTIKVSIPKGLKKVTKFSGKKKNQVKITYKSLNKKIATVNSKGKVTAKKKGTAKIKISMSAHDGKGVSVRGLTVKVRVK